MARHKKAHKKVDNLPIGEERIDCVWCWDSETGDKVLMDRLTNKEIGRWRKADVEAIKEI